MLQATNGAISKSYLDSRYGQLHMRHVAPDASSRTGLPIVLFGANPCSGIAFHELLLELGSDRVAIAFDSPGYGESSRPDHPLASALDYAKIFATAIGDLGLDRIDVMGDHSGAILALALAAEAPALVNRAVVSATPFLTDKALRLQRANRYPAFETDDPLPPHEQGKWRRYVLARPPEVSLARAMEIYTDALTPGVYTNWLFRAAYAADADTWLAGLETPVRFVQSDDGLTVHNADVAALIKRPSFSERPDLNYWSFQTRAGEWASEIREFCDAKVLAPT